MTKDTANELRFTINLRKSKDYRQGVLNAAVAFKNISHDEWCILSAKVRVGTEKIEPNEANEAKR